MLEKLIEENRKLRLAVAETKLAIARNRQEAARCEVDRLADLLDIATENLIRTTDLMNERACELAIEKA